MMLLIRQLCLVGFVFTLVLQLVSCGSPQRYVDIDEVTDDHEDALDSQRYTSNDGGNKRLSVESINKGLPTVESHHPFDPLDVFEMRLVATIVGLYNNTSTWQFKFIGLREPDKDAMYPYYLSQTSPPPGLIPRRANVLLADSTLRRPIWVVVNLSAFQVESWTEAGDGEKVSVITTEDNDLASKIAFENPHVIARIKALGYNGPKDVVAEVWDAGYVADNPNYAQARKIVQIYFYGYSGAGTNYWAHPMDFNVYVELGRNVVRGIENLPIGQGFDTTDRTGNSVPTAEANYLHETFPPNSIRPGLHRLKITQPEGYSFQISGREVSWQNFKLRIGYNPREGPYFYTISYTDKGVIRPIAYRMSFAEIFLRYADPRPPFHRKSSRDEETWEIGTSTFALPLHEFCRGNAYYFKADHHNEKAETWTVHNSICVVEEDDGILWAQRDPVTTKTAAVRNQRLSISHMTSIDFTLYWMNWRFYQDGTIELAIKITGTLSTNLMAIDVKAPPYGILVAPQVYTQIYQHFFAVRIDADIDGRDNTVSINDIVRVSETRSPENPYGSGLKINSTILKTVGEAPSDNLPTRSWKISNPTNIQYLSGEPVAWKLVPQGPNPSVPNLLTPDSPLRELAPWADHNTWVLPYDPEQIFAGGRYIRDGGPLTEGVAAWTQQNASANIENTDVVLWHVVNYVCMPEIEDWPVVSGCPTLFGFRLKPSGFFNENPSLRSPPASATTALDGTDGEGNSGWGSGTP